MPRGFGSSARMGVRRGGGDGDGDGDMELASDAVDVEASLRF